MVTIRLSNCRDGHQIRAWLKKLDALLDRHWLDRTYYRLESADRTLFIALVEEDRANYGAHVHMLLRLPPTVTLTWKRCEQVEFKARRLGVYDIQARAIEKNGSEAIAAAYCLKESWKAGNQNIHGHLREESLYFSYEFHPANPNGARPR